jgi:hypothetical protein
LLTGSRIARIGAAPVRTCPSADLTVAAFATRENAATAIERIAALCAQSGARRRTAPASTVRPTATADLGRSAGAANELVATSVGDGTAFDPEVGARVARPPEGGVHLET